MSDPFLVAQADGAWVRNDLWVPRMDLSRPELTLGYRQAQAVQAAIAQLQDLALCPFPTEAERAAEAMLLERTPFAGARLTGSGDQAMALALRFVGGGEVARLYGGASVHLPDGCSAVVAGLAGARLAPEGWLGEVAEAARAAGVPLILDERRTGLGRTGKLFAYQHEGLAPDLVVLGEGLGAGVVRAGALLGPKEVSALELEFGAGALAGRCAQVALEQVSELMPTGRALGKHLFVELRKLPGELVSALDALGLYAVLVPHERLGGAEKVARKLRDAGLFVHVAGSDALHICPPMTVTADELDWAVGHLHAVLWT